MSTSNTIYSGFSFIGLFLVCVPFPFRLKAWNIGTCLYGVWVALPLLAFCIASIIWKDDAINRAPVWCDISSRIISSNFVGITAASLCINRGLYNITSRKAISRSKAQKHRTIIIDLAIGVGLPALSMGLQYIFQFRRFVIIQEIGCYPSTLITPLALVLVNGPPLALSFISACYAIRTIIIRRQTEPEGIKRNPFGTPNFNGSLWYRLLALASAEVLMFLPFSIYSIIGNATRGYVGWVSWKDTHSRISQVYEESSAEWKSGQPMVMLELTRWKMVFLAFYFFALFGLTQDARVCYKMAWDFLKNSIGYSSPTERASSFRFRSVSDRLSSGGSSPGGNLNTSLSPAGENNNQATLECMPDRGGICKEFDPEAGLTQAPAPALTRSRIPDDINKETL